MSSVLPGFKTVLIGLLMAIVPVVTQYFGAVDWTSVLPAPWGMVVGGVVMIALRFVTSTPIFGGNDTASPPSQ